MRKITIPVSAVLALSAIQMAQAATITVDFSKAPSGALSDSYELNGFTFVGGKDCLFSNKYFVLGGRGLKNGRYIMFTPSKDGTLKYNVSTIKDRDAESIVATAMFDQLEIEANLSSVIARNTLPKKGNKNFSVNLVAGQTYYIFSSDNQYVNSISFVEVTSVRDKK